MKSRYVQRHDGEGWTKKSGVVFKMECCDCGLVHQVVVLAGKPWQLVGLAAKRDNRATGQRRRKRKEKKGS